MNRAMKFSLLNAFLMLVSALYVVGFMSRERDIASLGEFLFKLVPFVFAALSIAYFDKRFLKINKFTSVFVVLCFCPFFFFYVPKIFFYSLNDQWHNLYYLTLVISPMLILFLTFAYRLGGAGTGACLRVAFAMLLLMLSGLEDLMFLLINDHPFGRFNPIPQTWDWIPHMKVRIGHAPSQQEAYFFIFAHVALAVFILVYPFRMLQRLNERFFGTSA